MSSEEAITLTIRDHIGIITINVERKLNALTSALYGRIADLLEELAVHPTTYVTLIIGTGRFFSAGADVGNIKDGENSDMTAREYWVKSFVSITLYHTQVWHNHPKILVAALNGPVVGITASFISHSDFIYAAPHTYVMTPFSSLGLSIEGGASHAFVSRMGVGLANEALIMGKRIPAKDLLAVRFVNKIIHEGGGDPETGRGLDSAKFLEAVLREVDDRLGKHLNAESILKIKALLKKPVSGQVDKATVAEVLSGLRGFLKGVPQKEFRKVASGEKRHKL